MDTRLVTTFLTVARTGSLTAAAAELGYVQSTITAQLRALESELGVRLLDRSARGAVLTEAGRRLLPAAALTLEAVNGLRATAAAGTEPSGDVRVIAAESVCGSRIPAVVARLRRSHPAVRMVLTPGGTPGAIRALQTGEADLALVVEPKIDRRGLQALPLQPEPVLAVAAPDHPAVGRAAHWRDLAEIDVLLLEEGCAYSDAASALLAEIPKRQREPMRFGSIETVRQCAVAGLGVAVLPASILREEIARGTLVDLGLPGLPPYVVHLVRSRSRSLTAAAEVVWRALAGS